MLEGEREWQAAPIRFVGSLSDALRQSEIDRRPRRDMLIGDHDLVPIAIGVVDERIGSEAALGPSKAAAKPPFYRARIKTDAIAANRAGRPMLDDREVMRSADSEVEPPSRELATTAVLHVDSLLMPPGAQ